MEKTSTGWQLHKVLTDHDSWVVDVAINADAKIIASASRDRSVKLWNQDGKLLNTLQHQQSVTSVAITHNNQIISGSEEGNINIWQQGKLIQTLKGHTAAIQAIAITPNSNLIVSASEDKTLKIWRQGKLIKTLTGHTEAGLFHSRKNRR